MSKEKSNKSKKIKIEYVLIIILIILAILIFFSGSKLDFGINLFNSDEEVVTTQENLETKIKNLLSSIEGVGKTEVSINIDGKGEEVILKNTEIITENGSVTKTESAVLINGKPYVLKELTPAVLGVVVVCEGANDLNVKLKITEVLTTLLEVSSDNIRILKMK